MSYPVGAQFIGAPPIYRPGERIDAPLADDVILSEAKDLAAHPDKPFAEFTLNGAHVLRRDKL